MDETLKPRELVKSFLAPIAKAVPIVGGLGALAGAYESYKDNDGQINPEQVASKAITAAKYAPFLASPLGLYNLAKSTNNLALRKTLIDSGINEAKSFQGLESLNKLTTKDLMEKYPHSALNIMKHLQDSGYKVPFTQQNILTAQKIIEGYPNKLEINKLKHLIHQAEKTPEERQAFSDLLLERTKSEFPEVHLKKLMDKYQGAVTNEQFANNPAVLALKDKIIKDNIKTENAHAKAYAEKALLNAIRKNPEGMPEQFKEHVDALLKHGYELQPHQRRVIDKLKASGGVLVAHGVGSGKTLSSIAAAEEMGLPTDVIVPAPLIANYNKELEKHLGNVPSDMNIQSYQKATGIRPDSLAILDEAHRARNTGTVIDKNIIKNLPSAKARMLLTGTPVYNSPSDLAQLVNAAAGKDILPADKKIFNQLFVGEKTIEPGFFDKTFRQMEASKVPELKNKEQLVNMLKGYVDVHMQQGKDYPNREDYEYSVAMSPEQHKMYNFHEGQLPFYVRNKIKAGMPLDKQESNALNAFEGALRQTSNTPRPFMPGMSDDEELNHTPKINLMAKHLQDMHASDPNFRGVVYSNYINGGLVPMSNALKKAGIPHNLFTGDVSKAERAKMVEDYNTGKVPVLLVSSSGTEGLDLKGTKSVQVMEPHWNDAKIDQVIGRGIRYKSHEHLPEHERKVKIMRYYTEKPKPDTSKIMEWIKPQYKDQDTGIERYMQNTANYKNLLSKQILDAMQEASDAGPLNKMSALDLATIKLPSDITVEDNAFVFKGPKGNNIYAPFEEEQLSKFKGDQNDFINKLRQEMLLASETAVAKARKDNEKNKEIAGNYFGGLTGSAMGFLGTMAPSHLGSSINMLNHIYPHNKYLSKFTAVYNSMPVQIAAQLGVGGLGTYGGYHVGKNIGEAFYKRKAPEDYSATVESPFLLAPKEVKHKTKLKSR